jgi:hypothetical protein
MKKDPRYGPERVEAFRRKVPKGKIRVIELPPLRGEMLEPITWAALGLEPGRRRAA